MVNIIYKNIYMWRNRTRGYSFTDRQKRSILLDLVKGEKNMTQIAEDNNVAVGLVNKFKNYSLPVIAKFSDRLDEIIEKNNVTLSVIDEQIMDKLMKEEIKVKELIALKDLVVKQNRLLQGESTENVAAINISFNKEMD